MNYLIIQIYNQGDHIEQQECGPQANNQKGHFFLLDFLEKDVDKIKIKLYCTSKHKIKTNEYDTS